MERYCPRCDKTKSISDFYQRHNPRCEADRFQSYCKSCVRERTHAFYIKNKKRYQQREKERRTRLGDGLRQQKREQRAALRIEVVKAYGGKCKCCGEVESSFLAIDHINGGGKKHYKEIGGASSLPYWLKRNGYPDNFQVLCHNCNMGKSINGVCPHLK